MASISVPVALRLAASSAVARAKRSKTDPSRWESARCEAPPSLSSTSRLTVDDCAGSQWFPESGAARLFLLVCLIESVVDLGLEVYVIVRTDLFDGLKSSITRMPLAVYLMIFGLAHIFQVVLAWDALTVKNTIQVLRVFYGRRKGCRS